VRSVYIYDTIPDDLLTFHVSSKADRSRLSNDSHHKHKLNDEDRRRWAEWNVE